jgi:putative ABC transport system permease protein
MIAPRWRKVLRDLWLHKPRTLLVVGAIAIGIMGAGAVLDTWSILRIVTEDGYLATNPASATLRMDSVDDALLARVRAIPSIREAEARRTAVGAATVRGATFSALLFASRDPSTKAIGKVVRDSGEWPPADGSIVIEHSSMEYAGLAIGDIVTVQLPGGAPLDLKVAGVARDQGLAPGWMDHVVYAFVTPATLARLNRGDAALNQMQIIVRNGAGVSFDREANRRTALRVKAAAESAGHEVTEVDVPIPGRHMHAAQMDSLLMTQGAFGVLALVLSGFLVVNLIAAMLAGQVREIGVMKSIGARASQIGAMYLALALGLGVVACIVAIPLAAVIGWQYAEFSASLLNFSVAGVGIPARIIVAQLAVGALLPVVAAALPVVRGCRISVSEALRDFGVGAHDGGKGGGVLRGASGMARPLLLSLRNAFRHRERMALTLLSLSLGGAVFLGALNLRASIRGSVALIYDTYNKFDLSVRFAQPHAADSIEAATARIAGVAAAEAWAGARAAVDRSDGMLAASFPLTGLAPESKLVAFPVAEGRWVADGATNEMVVSKRLLEDEPALAPGAEVVLLMNGVRSRWRVVGLVESGPMPAAYAPREAAIRALGDARVRIVAVRAGVAGAPPQAEFVERVRAELDRAGFEVESSSLVTANREAVEDHLLMVTGFLVVMAQLTIAVGGLGLASTMSISVLERTREIGVLRAIGARHGRILWMIQVEGLVISLLSWLLAIPLSLPMSILLGKAFGKVMFPVATTYVPDASGVAIWFGVVVTVSLLACAWPARRATRITTAAALAYE